MHPVISAWLAYSPHMDTQPPAWGGARWRGAEEYARWLDQAIVLSDWFNTLRRLRF